VTNIPVTDYGLPDNYVHVYSGKVRDLYRTPDDRLLFIASDRISAYDWVLPTTIPDKGRILTKLSLWWFQTLEGVVPNHLETTAVPKVVAGRAMICEPLEMLPVECVVRGYLAGSGLADYKATRQICGNGLPPGLVDGSLLPKPIFTPATKAAIAARLAWAPGLGPRHNQSPGSWRVRAQVIRARLWSITRCPPPGVADGGSGSLPGCLAGSGPAPGGSTNTGTVPLGEASSSSGGLQARLTSRTTRSRSGTRAAAARARRARIA
jgi:hypothetical protein